MIMLIETQGLPPLPHVALQELYRVHWHQPVTLASIPDSLSRSGESYIGKAIMGYSLQEDSLSANWRWCRGSQGDSRWKFRHIPMNLIRGVVEGVWLRAWVLLGQCRLSYFVSQNISVMSHLLSTFIELLELHFSNLIQVWSATAQLHNATDGIHVSEIPWTAYCCVQLFQTLWVWYQDWIIIQY